MRYSGRTTVDFGSQPGTAHATTAVASPEIRTLSRATGYLERYATADHSEDEHTVESIDVTVGDRTPGTGFTLHAVSRSGPLTGVWAVGWEHD